LGEVSKTQSCRETSYLLDLRASIPTTVIVTAGAVHDVNIMDKLFWEW
jgi:hypothetical protein